jgi:hypothetical protein
MRAPRPVRGYWSSVFFPPRLFRAQVGGIGTSTVVYPPRAEATLSRPPDQFALLSARVSPGGLAHFGAPGARQPKSSHVFVGSYSAGEALAVAGKCLVVAACGG